MPRADRDAALATELDAHLDALSRGHPLPAGEEESVALTNVARRLQQLGDRRDDPHASVPLPWAAVLTRAEATGAALPSPSWSRPRLEARPRWRFAFGELTTAALVLLLLVGGFAVFARDGRRPAGSDDPRVAVYLSDPYRFGLIRLDPVTLLDDPTGSPLSLATPVPSSHADDGPEPADYWIASADGSTLVAFTRLSTVSGQEAVVFDLPSGRVRGHFIYDGEAGPGSVHLTADGRRLVVENPYAGEPGAPTPTSAPRWSVYDTATGETVRTIPGAWPSAGLSSSSGVVNSVGDRLYSLSVLDATSTPRSGPWPVRLVAYDLETGGVTGTLDLPETTGGSWVGGRVVGVEDLDLVYTRSPALALSADGRRLAVIDGSGSTVTFVDTERMAVERSVAVGIGAGLLAATPRVTREDLDRMEATYAWDLGGGSAWDPDYLAVGAHWFLAFAPDGRLLVSGNAIGQVPWMDIATGFGLTALDPTTGEAERLDIGDLVLVPDQPATDDLYAWSIALPERDEATPRAPRFTPVVTVYRLDSDTLEVRASRTLDGYHQLVVLPVGPT